MFFFMFDGKYVILGYFYDEKGKNFSEGIFQKEIYVLMGCEMWKQFNVVYFLKEGVDNVLCKVFVFVDLFCLYCKVFWLEVQLWVMVGKVQFNMLLVVFFNLNSGCNVFVILNVKDLVMVWKEYELFGGKKLFKLEGIVLCEIVVIL